MCRILILLALTFVIITFPVFSDDLYLLDIKSNHELDRVNGIVDHAHGIIAGKFIVELNTHQITKLESLKINLQFLLKNCNLNNIYLLMSKQGRKSKTALSIPSIYKSSSKHIVELQESSIDILIREGYKVFSLSQRKTPFFHHPRLYSGPLLIDYPSDTLADLVSQDSLFSFTSRLQAFYTRFSLSDSIILAGNWLEEKFEEFGYTDVEQQEFLATKENWNVYDYPFYNVVCYKEGTQQPDKLIVIGGHYDSITDQGMAGWMVFAPGADDNASGTAAVLELARIFKNVEFKKSIMFVAFTAEEVWGIGSETIAGNLYDASVDVELMINLDMIANTYDSGPDVDIAGFGTMAYYYTAATTAARVSGLVPDYYGENVPSDDLSFSAYGYYTIAFHETDFSENWHTIHDSTIYMDFPYFEKIVRAVAATVPIIDGAPDPVTCYINDIGDGQSLRVSWDDCREDYSYQVVYGTDIDDLINVMDVPPPECHYDITGLTEGDRYHFYVICITDEGWPSLGWEISSEVPRSIPRQPAGMIAFADSAAIRLYWNKNIELDISHYNILRQIHGETWSILPINVTDTTYVDYNVESGITYSYAVMAVDYDLNQSDTSDISSAAPATFDNGILFVDETQEGSNGPTDAEQSAFYNSVFSGYMVTRRNLNDEGDLISRSFLGQFNPAFWVDDDTVLNLFGESIDSMQWYLDYHTDLFLAGWSTIYSIAGQTYFYPGDFYYDQLGISYIAENPLSDFTGATGVNGWPDLELKVEAPGGGRMPNIDRFAATPESEVIYTFNSYSGNPAYNGKPVGIALDTYHGKRVVLGFPLYWLTETSAQALITRVMEYFTEESILYGDVSGDWSINILDVTALIAYLYQGGESPADMNNGDPNGDCNVNILDITYLIGYLYKNGPVPIEGCYY